jgi:hypothetical protein
MALTSYTTLKSAVADWLNRTDLTSQIPDFIALAEAKMSRTIRKWTVRDDAFTIDDAQVAGPVDCLIPRSIRLISGSPSQDRPLRLCTIEMLNERKARSGNVAGRPTDCAFVDGYFYFAPEPDQTYTAELFYHSTLAPLSSTVSTNAVLDDAPDAYLYGTLAAAEPFLEHDDRAATWMTLHTTAVNELNALREEIEFTLSTKDVRLPTVFG